MPDQLINVLLIDDDRDDYLLTRELLSDLDGGRIELDWQSDYPSGLEALCSGEHDICLLDYHLGAHTGIELLVEAQRVGNETPVIMLTGLRDREVDIVALNSGAADYLVKGEVTPSLLERAIRYTLERQKMQAALHRSEEQYALVSRGTNDGLWDWNVHTGEVYYSSRWRSILGYPEQEMHGDLDDWFHQIHPDDIGRVRANLDRHLKGLTPHFECEHRLRTQNGGFHWVLCRGAAVMDAASNPVRVAGSLTDLNQRGVFDALTGLPNRTLLLNSLKRAFDRSKRNPERISAVLFMDLNNFKVINDSLGHQTGDELLTELARRLKYCVRHQDTIARWGGDEFVILLEDLDNDATLIKIAKRIARYLTSAFEFGGQTVFSSFSMGIVADIRRYDNIEDILRDADIAMYQAKEEKLAFMFFKSAMQRSAVTRHQKEVDLRKALKEEEFCVVYQPIVSLSSGKIRGFEALVRWRHPERGVIFPGEFIPLLEETGLIIPLGKWILKQACKQAAIWSQDIPADDGWVVCVNLSSQQLSPDFVEHVKKVLQATGLKAAQLELEITESAIIESPTEAKPILEKLKATGVRIAMDDFGTGYSSLSYLHELPIDTLKIDRSFVNKVGDDPTGSAIIHTIAKLARILRLQVIAEGIETAEQLEALKDSGCHYGQGYLFSKAVEPQAATRLLEAQRSEAPAR